MPTQRNGPQEWILQTRTKVLLAALVEGCNQSQTRLTVLTFNTPVLVELRTYITVLYI